MRIPNSLLTLADQGIIDDVVRPLMSGKEAEVFLVRSGGELRVAKVYKEAHKRSFKNRAEYTEGRKVRNSRDQRAINKRSSHGKAQDEAAWRSSEVDIIYRLSSAGVRVPKPYHYIDGVLIMELVTDADGNPAPRLAEVSMDADEAGRVFDYLLAEVIRMLCAGVVHGDLSDFNVLVGTDSPVIIDFPQSVDASSNQNARKLLLRDVDNLQRFLSRFAPNRAPRHYAQEMWDLYACSQLTPETKLTGRYRPAERRPDMESVLELIGDANFDERSRRESLGLSMRGFTPTQQQQQQQQQPQRYAQQQPQQPQQQWNQQQQRNPQQQQQQQWNGPQQRNPQQQQQQWNQQQQRNPQQQQWNGPQQRNPQQQQWNGPQQRNPQQQQQRYEQPQQQQRYPQQQQQQRYEQPQQQQRYPQQQQQRYEQPQQQQRYPQQQQQQRYEQPQQQRYPQQQQQRYEQPQQQQQRYEQPQQQQQRYEQPQQQRNAPQQQQQWNGAPRSNQPYGRPAPVTPIVMQRRPEPPRETREPDETPPYNPRDKP